MKKLIPVVLSMCLLLVPMAGPVSADAHGQPPAAAEPAAQPELSPVPDIEPEAPDMHPAAPGEEEPPEDDFVPGCVPADSALTDAIVLPVTALVLSMAEQDLTYDSRSDVFVWNALYYTLSLYGQMDDRAGLGGGELEFPSETAQDYLAALFAGAAGLPELPEELLDRVSYDPESDQFLLSQGDFGMAEVCLEALLRQPDGTCTASGVLAALEDGSVLCRFQVTLVENDTMFGFSICGLTLE